MKNERSDEKNMIEKLTESDIRRFWSKVDKTPTCWLWTAAVQNKGYGRFFLYPKNRLAHRVSLWLHGIETPKGMFVDHMCKVPRCCRPEHLRVVTKKTNALENNLSPFARNAAATACPQGHPYTGPNVYVYTPPKQLTRQGGQRSTVISQRQCNTCYLAQRWEPEKSHRWHPELAAMVASARAQFTE